MAAHSISVSGLYKRDWNKFANWFLLGPSNSLVPEQLEGVIETDQFQLTLSEKGNRDSKKEAP